MKSLYSDMKIFTLRWLFFIVIEIPQGNENSLSAKIIHCDENQKMCWTFKIMLDIHHYYEYASSWWKFIKMIKICDFDVRFFIFSQLWWPVFGLIEIHDEDSSLWWEFIIVMKIHHYDENYLYQIHYFDVIKSTYWVI